MNTDIIKAEPPKSGGKTLSKIAKQSNDSELEERYQKWLNNDPGREERFQKWLTTGVSNRKYNKKEPL